MIDSHIHVGQFYDIYTSPTKLLRFMDSVGVGCFAVSSTTICEMNYRKVLREIKELIVVGGRRVIPVLWIVPAMIDDGGVHRFLDSGICWKCLKIHPQLNPDAWAPDSDNMERVIGLARRLGVPILIHTAMFPCCHAGLYKHTISVNSDITFILAHGRPIDETIDVLKSCPNAYTDTAFMPTEEIVKLCTAGLAERVLWGTDYPIPQYFFHDRDMKEYYHSLLESVRKGITQEQYLSIMSKNAKDVWDKQ